MKGDILNKQESASLTAASDDDIHGTVKLSPEESGSGASKARAGGEGYMITVSAAVAAGWETAAFLSFRSSCHRASTEPDGKPCKNPSKTSTSAPNEGAGRPGRATNYQR